MATFKLYKDVADKWRWRLVAANNVKIASSGESFSSKASARTAAETVKSSAPGATIED